jgi:hypothetical protein
MSSIAARASVRLAVVASVGLLWSTTVAGAPAAAPAAGPVDADDDDPVEPPTDERPDASPDEDAVDHSASWAEVETTSDPPATPIAAPSEPAEPSPPSAVEDPDQAKRKAAESTAIAGYVFVGLGAATLVILSGGAWVAAKVAESRANDDPILVSRSELMRRVERRERFARISAIAGGSVLLVGGILIAAGLGSRATLRARGREVAFAPMIGPTQGLQVELRF